jgi:thiamine-monophosphate kinase
MSDPTTESISDLGEFALIQALVKRLPQGPDVLLGPGDDAAVVRSEGGSVVVSTDVLVSTVHFRTDWAPPYDIGRRAAAASLADIAAMGGRTTALVVALSAPPDLAASWALGLADGLRDEAAEVGASVAGGDLARSSQLAIAVTALGTLDGRDPVTRGGAAAGDVVALAGRLGWAEAGLAVLSRGFRSPRVLVDAYRRPDPPYRAGPAAAASGATAMCDVSDGLVADLGHLATASGVSLEIDSSGLEVAVPVQSVAAAYGVDPLEWVLAGGHDHALVATFPQDSALPEGFALIGSATAASEGANARVLVDGTERSGPGGHEHF